MGLLYMHKGRLAAREEDLIDAIGLLNIADAYFKRSAFKEMKTESGIDEAFELVKACQDLIVSLEKRKAEKSKKEEVSIVLIAPIPELEGGKNSAPKNDIVEKEEVQSRQAEEAQKSKSWKDCFKMAENLAERAKYEDDYGCLQTAMDHYNRAAVLYQKAASGPNINTTEAINKMERCLIRRDFLGGVLRRHRKRHFCSIL